MPRDQRRSTDRQEHLLGAVAGAVKDIAPLPDRRNVRRFISEYYRNLSSDDIDSTTTHDLAAAAMAHLRFGRRRAPGSHRLRVYNPTEERDGWSSPHTIVELVHENMPFLVDSLSMTVDRAGFTILLTIHPLIRCVRTPGGQLRTVRPRGADEGAIESFIRLELREETRAGKLRELVDAIEDTLTDVRAAVRDWHPMRQRMTAAIEMLESRASGPAEIRDESVALLRWLANERFTYLGYREYRLQETDNGTHLRPVANSALGVNTVGNRKGTTHKLSPAMQRYRRSPELLLITKANSRSTVHRPSYLDYIGIKSFDAQGRAFGEIRFLGLFTSQTYNEPVSQIPLIRGKIEDILERAGIDPTGHRGKALMHILNEYPRDELFQASAADLYRTTSGILNLQERRRVKLFIRRDTFRRFFSCLVFVPREKYNTEVRERTEEILMDALGGVTVEAHVQLSDSALARVHLLVYVDSSANTRVSVRAIEARISQAVVTWQDRLRDALIDRLGSLAGADCFERYARVFPLAYAEDVDATAAVDDIEMLERQREHDANPLGRYRLSVDQGQSLRFQMLRFGAPLALSDALPLLENLGMRVITERPYGLRIPDRRAWLQDFELETRLDTTNRKIESIAAEFIHGFHAQLMQSVERDRYNLLIVTGGLSTRDVTIVRAYAKYLLQLGLPFSQRYLEEMFSEHAQVLKAATRWFVARFDPEATGNRRTRTRLENRVREGIADASSLDADRALRALFATMRATVRTNVFAVKGDLREEAYAFKIDTAAIDEAPLPRPAHEIFVYSPRVEGVHLRAGDIARGGLRWSDRRDDYRTEILGLMKAQTVKNTVIVPTGAKGGFYPKQLPDGDRGAVLTEAVTCYRMFITALLSVTDNIIDGEIVSPPQVVVHDRPDPYLVVAADKGTATFSDIANEIAVARGFWLGDAFASGGSAGYDHKKMAITARGAWEAVKRHFREMGIDTQTDAFTVAGIGDMSGDVFGNGMLLSETIRLQAAFNHRHIFIDPNPDPAASFAERRRLFELPRSGWDDYDATLISAGGGVFDRNAKAIALSKEIRRLLGTDEETVTPLELIRLILKMPVDLLWNGGIGTYVKASHESHGDAGDRQNDALRVDATQLRCKVVGEGGNLGLTQLGRVEFAALGGRINTDFIDNSAGVDSSDREVNIKILLRLAMADGRLSRKRRDRLLASMTDEVAQLVLRNNYMQTQAISMMEARAPDRLSEHQMMIQTLIRSGLLNRKLEGLPDDEAMDERRRDGRGLTRPELSVLLSYAKLDLYQRLSAYEFDVDARQVEELTHYFPTPLHKRYGADVPYHQLGQEILTTLLTNSLVNRMGPAFALRAREDTGSEFDRIAHSYVIARDLIDARNLWGDIEAMDTRIPADIQYSMMFEIARKLRHVCYWILRNGSPALDVETLTSELAGPVQSVLASLPELLTGDGRDRLEQLNRQHQRMGVPGHLSQRVSALTFVTDVLEIVRIAQERHCATELIARAYFGIGRRLQLDWVRQAIDSLSVDGRWQARARGTLRERAVRAQRDLTSRVHSINQCRLDDEDIDALIASDEDGFNRVLSLLEIMRENDSLDFATLTVAVDELALVAAADGE